MQFQMLIIHVVLETKYDKHFGTYWNRQILYNFGKQRFENVPCKNIDVSSFLQLHTASTECFCINTQSSISKWQYGKTYWHKHGIFFSFSLPLSRNIWNVVRLLCCSKHTRLYVDSFEKCTCRSFDNSCAMISKNFNHETFNYFLRQCWKKIYKTHL